LFIQINFARQATFAPAIFRITEHRQGACGGAFTAQKVEHYEIAGWATSASQIPMIVASKPLFGCDAFCAIPYQRGVREHGVVGKQLPAEVLYLRAILKMFVSTD